MQRRADKSITLEQKLRYLKEIESIHAMGKKVRPPPGKSWGDIADARMRHVMNLPIRESRADPITIQRGKAHHEHSPRSARIIERTLKTGLVSGPHQVRDFHTGGAVPDTRFRFRDVYVPHVQSLQQDDMRVQHVVQHGGADSELHYPHGHMQGVGFVPRQHEINSHVRLSTSTAPDASVVPTKEGAAAGSHYH